MGGFKRFIRHPGKVTGRAVAKTAKKIAKSGVSAGVGVGGGGVQVNGNIGKVPVVSIPVVKQPTANKNKVLTKPTPQPQKGGCFGVAPKQITTKLPNISPPTETLTSLRSKIIPLLGSYVGESKHCVALVKALVPTLQQGTATWTRGVKVQGSTLKPGTPIATFEPNGTYGNKTDGSSHAAIFIRHVPGGIKVYDQWVGQPAHCRVIRYKRGQGTANNDADRYYTVITQAQKVAEVKKN